MPPIYVSGKKKGLRPGSTKMSHHSFFEVAKPAQAHTAQKRAMKRQFECEQCFEKLVHLIVHLYRTDSIRVYIELKSFKIYSGTIVLFTSMKWTPYTVKSTLS